ncbi:hypothetical protein TSTA_029680 [Talaromyces stipitatus ATCC 10500]|uniref:Reverse transcriptase Ty1/copia-type domain-containing protein n=1 Tax=Talaromyces stipitatus (strain ATCC 10500 / CBS 375.48 / QM 6759 / NRRL 1006) TaxID=441959 RepID=B8M588_TALSN|nr:uncharacterized protein TSTA_029680 [Talaromyces stipitatus ATCC 10500]EED19694.1 hypothetical protein TSTA_029680 [Talaromyces stipitatus ATCC 10500]
MWFESVYCGREESFVELVARFEGTVREDKSKRAYATFGGNNADNNNNNSNTNPEQAKHEATRTYLNAKADKNGYFIKIPTGIPGDPDIYYRLLKALHGLKQSPLLWQREFTVTIIELGFKQISEELCLFKNEDGIILFFHIGDVVTLFLPNQEHLTKALWDSLMKKYPARSMGELAWFHRMRAEVHPRAPFRFGGLGHILTRWPASGVWRH